MANCWCYCLSLHNMHAIWWLRNSDFFILSKPVMTQVSWCICVTKHHWVNKHSVKSLFAIDGLFTANRLHSPLMTVIGGQYCCIVYAHNIDSITLLGKWTNLGSINTAWLALLTTSWCEEFVLQNMKMYLHFLWNLDTETSQVIETHFQDRQEYPHFTQSLLWLLMAWWHKEPSPQQPWYFPSLLEIFQSRHQKG